MQGRFSAETCGAEVVAVAGRLVAATQALWARVAPKMLPTPAKFHYLFNMRDISKVCQIPLEKWSGLLQQSVYTLWACTACKQHSKKV
jgi:hypothetical protein